MKGPPARHDEPKEVYPAVEGIIADAGELERGDRVVYPNQGVCRITGLEVKEIAGQRLELVRMEREEDGAAVLVPRAKVPTVGLRRVASADQIEGVIHFLAAQFEDPELDWKVRHRDNADRLIAGGVLGVAEVVKGLHSLSRIRPLPTKEREQYDNARHLLVHEIAVSLAVPPALAEDYIDYALMPPEGVVFELKPPPKPVQLPIRPRRRIVRPAEEEDDLGLESLGIDLGTGDVELPGAGLADIDVPLPPAEAVEGTEPAEEGAADDLGLPGDKEEPASEDEEEARPAPVPVKQRPPVRAVPAVAAAKKSPPLAPKAEPPKPKQEKKREEKKPADSKKKVAPAKPEKAAPKKAVKPAAKAVTKAPAKPAKAPAKKSAKAIKAKAAPAKKAAKPAKKPARGGSKK